jgi:hypothetical protein
LLELLLGPAELGLQSADLGLGGLEGGEGDAHIATMRPIGARGNVQDSIRFLHVVEGEQRETTNDTAT